MGDRATNCGEGSGEILQNLDDALPGSIDRRRFLTATVGTMAGGLLAGCGGLDGGGAGSPTDDDTETPTGGGTDTPTGDGTATDQGDDTIIKNVTWRQPWKPEPTWSIAWVAEEEGFWTDQAISSPTVREGFGSPDTARRIGTGTNEMGHADIGASIAGIAQGYDLNVFAVTRQRSLLGLIYREDRMDGPEDMPGKSVGLASPFAEETWPVFPEAVGVSADEIQAEFVSEDIAPGLLAEGQHDAIWGAMDLFGVYRDAVAEDVGLGVAALNNYLTVYGYPAFVNGSWVQEGNNMEYLTRVLTGYSQAAKWCLLHPDETIDILINSVNEALGAQERSTLENQFQVLSAFSVSEEARENGFGYFSEDALQNTLDAVSGLAEDPSNIPSASDLMITEPMENAELATFTDDEWNQIADYAGMFGEFYQTD